MVQVDPRSHVHDKRIVSGDDPIPDWMDGFSRHGQIRIPLYDIISMGVAVRELEVLLIKLKELRLQHDRPQAERLFSARCYIDQTRKKITAKVKPHKV